jgi:hypothetical protein
MKQLIFLIVIFLSTSVYANKYQTNVQGVYVKNFSCNGNRAHFNLVNKSSKTIYSIKLIAYDSDNDPIDYSSKNIYLGSGEGLKTSVYIDCSQLISVGFKV